MNGRRELEEMRSLFLACLRAATPYALGALPLSVFLKAVPGVHSAGNTGAAICR